eukprot:403335835
MKANLSTIIALLSFVNQLLFIAGQSNDELLFVFQLTKSGLSNGYGLNPFQQYIDSGLLPDINSTYKQGELSDMGRRQQFLLGQQLRLKYIEQKNLISQDLNPAEIFVRVQNSNKSSESAEALLHGLYSPNLQNQRVVMQDNQSASAIPEMQMHQELLSQSQTELANNPLPFNYYLPALNVYNRSQDLFNPLNTCPQIQNDILNRQQNLLASKILDTKYQNSLINLAQILNISPSLINSSIALQYADTIASLYLQQYQMPGLDRQLATDMISLKKEFLNMTIGKNSTTNKAYLTTLFTEMLNLFQSTIDLHSNGSLERAVNRIKYYMAFAEDELLINLARSVYYSKSRLLLNATSTVLFELHKTVVEGETDPTYYVNMTINGEQISLPGACQNYKKCLYSSFVKLVKSSSYYGDQDSFEKVCGVLPEDNYNQIMNQWMGSFPENVVYMSHNYKRIIYAYVGLTIIILLIWLYWEKRKYRKRKQRTSGIEMSKQD